MLRGRGALVYSILMASVAVAPFTLAFRDGAGPERTGGPLGAGANCTECHGYNGGPGRVDLFGVDRRYIPGAVYDLTVRVADDNELGAGFEISAETITAHVGMLLIADAVNTRYSGVGGSNSNYVTHTLDGVLDSVANWAARGNAVDYAVQWQAPMSDVGSVYLFGVGIAMNNNLDQTDDKYYATYAALRFAEAYDGDGDTDGDLFDVAMLQRCFGAAVVDALDACAYVDDGDGLVNLNDWSGFAGLFDGPTAAEPAGYVLADAVRGGLLYDRWWRVNGAPTPAGDHPLWGTRPDQESNTRTGSTTFRCKECHGWDYQGVDGAYGSGSHRTGFAGIFGSTKTPREIFDLLKANPVETPNGHDMDAYGMSDRDIWDAVKFTLEGVVDTDEFIDGKGLFNGDPLFGGFLYPNGCASCHGEEGTGINFGSAKDPQYLGGISRENPWEVLHKMRFGQPGTPMRGAELLGWADEVFRNVGAFCQTLQ